MLVSGAIKFIKLEKEEKKVYLLGTKHDMPRNYIYPEYTTFLKILESKLDSELIVYLEFPIFHNGLQEPIEPTEKLRNCFFLDKILVRACDVREHYQMGLIVFLINLYRKFPERERVEIFRQFANDLFTHSTIEDLVEKYGLKFETYYFQLDLHLIQRRRAAEFAPALIDAFIKEYHEKVIQNLENEEVPATIPALFDVPTICDILNDQHKKIMVFSGAGHSTAIAEVLEREGFQRVEEQNNDQAVLKMSYDF